MTAESQSSESSRLALASHELLGRSVFAFLLSAEVLLSIARALPKFRMLTSYDMQQAMMLAVGSHAMLAELGLFLR